MLILRTQNAVYNLKAIKRIKITVDNIKVFIHLDEEIEEVCMNESSEANEFKVYFLNLLKGVMSGFYTESVIDLTLMTDNIREFLKSSLEDLLL